MKVAMRQSDANRPYSTNLNSPFMNFQRLNDSLNCNTASVNYNSMIFEQTPFSEHCLSVSFPRSDAQQSLSMFMPHDADPTYQNFNFKRKSKRGSSKKISVLDYKPQTVDSTMDILSRDYLSMCSAVTNDSIVLANNEVSMSDISKRCKVCGDRAMNHNFGQLTCESCKAFFRRNAHKVLPAMSSVLRLDSQPNTMTYFQAIEKGLVELACTSKNGEHIVSPSTRRECPACRLKRCFMIGMRPDLIQVRKKDGTKPRWLDKSPTAAQIHELNVLRPDVKNFQMQSFNDHDLSQNNNSALHIGVDPFESNYLQVCDDTRVDSKFKAEPPDRHENKSEFKFTDGPELVCNKLIPKNRFKQEDAQSSVSVSSDLPNNSDFQNPEFMYAAPEQIFSIEDTYGRPSRTNTYDIPPSSFSFHCVPSPKKMANNETDQIFDYSNSDCIVLTNPLSDDNYRSTSIWKENITNHETSLLASQPSWNTLSTRMTDSSDIQLIQSNVNLLSASSNIQSEISSFPRFAAFQLHAYSQLPDDIYSSFPQNSNCNDKFKHTNPPPNTFTECFETLPSPDMTKFYSIIANDNINAKKSSLLEQVFDANNSDWFTHSDTQYVCMDQNTSELYLKPTADAHFKESNDIAEQTMEIDQLITYDSTVGGIDTDSDVSNTSVWFSKLIDAWNLAWRGGVFPNPAKVGLNLDLNSHPNTRWHLTFANILTDLILRRAATFLASIFNRDLATSLDFSSSESFSVDFSTIDETKISEEAFLWMFKNRLTACVPVILARSICHEIQTECDVVLGSEVRTNMPYQHSAVEQSSYEEENANYVKIDRLRDNEMTTCSSMHYIDSNSATSSSACNSQISISFQVPPNSRVFISLSKVGSKFHLHNISESGSGSISVPRFSMLEYIDAYIYELDKLLRKNQISLGSFMAIKLTEEPTDVELDYSPMSDLCKLELHRLNSTFKHIFSQSNVENYSKNPRYFEISAEINPNNVSESINCSGRNTIETKIMSMTSKLNNFLHWGHEFDREMENFLLDVYINANENTEISRDWNSPISPGFSAIFSYKAKVRKYKLSQVYQHG